MNCINIWCKNKAGEAPFWNWKTNLEIYWWIAPAGDASDSWSSCLTTFVFLIQRFVVLSQYCLRSPGRGLSRIQVPVRVTQKVTSSSDPKCNLFKAWTNGVTFAKAYSTKREHDLAFVRLRFCGWSNQWAVSDSGSGIMEISVSCFFANEDDERLLAEWCCWTTRVSIRVTWYGRPDDDWRETADILAKSACTKSFKRILIYFVYSNWECCS